MATGWLKSLQCKSSVLDDVVRPSPVSLLHPAPKKKPKPSFPSDSFSYCLSSTAVFSSSASSSCPAATAKKSSLLPLGCGNSPRFLKDVAFHLPNNSTSCSNKPQRRRRRRHHDDQHQWTEQPNKHSSQHHLRKPWHPASPLHAICPPPPPLFPTLVELPRGHSSRRVVELIFSSSWPRSPSDSPFRGSFEMLFRIHHPARATAAFEEYRDDVRSRAGPGDARCAANGNETMRFHPYAARIGGEQPIYDGAVRVLPGTIMDGMKGGTIRTFAGSGRAHDVGDTGSDGGGGRAVQAMLVCRVIAGRVRAELGDRPDEYESVAAGKGELFVFDPRAVLPCFLIIYKL